MLQCQVVLLSFINKRQDLENFFKIRIHIPTNFKYIYFVFALMPLPLMRLLSLRLRENDFTIILFNFFCLELAKFAMIKALKI